jgi:CRISPR-associated protein (TIGR03986 family)
MTTTGFRFIPIDPHIIEPPVRFDDLDLARPLPNGSVSGSLQITWTAETPVCIGDGEDPVRPIQIGGDYVLPGASLRGMVRAVVEIAAFSHLGHINAARHYGVRTYAAEDMPPTPQRHAADELKSGWLTYDGKEWKLQPCMTNIPVRIGRNPLFPNERGYWLLPFSELVSKISPALDDVSWRKKELAEKHANLGTARLIGEIRFVDDRAYLAQAPRGVRVARFAPSGGERGYVICAGRADPPPPRQPKSYEAVFARPDPHRSYVLPRSFMTLFQALHSNPGRDDREPRENWRFWLTKMGWPGVYGVCGTRDLDYRAYPGIPVFYHGDPAAVATDAGGPMATRPFFMGLTRVLRLPWPYSVGDVAHRLYHDHESGVRRHYQVPRLGKPGGWDFARALFGEVDDAHMDREATRKRGDKEDEPRALAGRVSFSPAFAEGDPQPSHSAEGVFGTPRESFYPFYLARAANGSPTGTQRYDDPHAIPAGRKRYVVRRDPMPLPQGNANPETVTRVEFLPSGTRFVGTVRFHNLDPVELGALLWALSFGEWGGNRYRHQIGRGKAQGYGVMRADTAWRPPRIVNRDKIEPAGDLDKSETYLDVFRSHMTERLGGDFEATPQITALRCYADPEVGDKKQDLLITLPLEDHGRMTYPQLKRDFDKTGNERGYPAGAKSVLAPLK